MMLTDNISLENCQRKNFEVDFTNRLNQSVQLKPNSITLAGSEPAPNQLA